jgi:hypothetical protein
MWVNGIVAVLAVVAVGIAGGSAIGSFVKRRAPTAKDASRRSHLLSVYVMLLIAAVVIVKAVVIADHRGLLLSFAAILVVSSLVVLRNTLRRTAPDSGSADN